MPKWQEQKPKYLHAQKRKGVWYTYYRRDGRYVPIEGEPGTAAWLRSYSQIHDDWCAEAPSLSRHSIEGVIAAFCARKKFKATTEKNQARRRMHFNDIRTAWDKIDIRRIKRHQILAYRDLIADKRSPSISREHLGTLKALLSFAFERGLVEIDITENVQNPDDYAVDPHAPWTDEQISEFLERAPDRWRRAVMVLLHTGLRLGDAVSIRRQNIRDGAIFWKTSKKGKEVCIPLTTALQTELARPLRIDSMYLIAGLKGGSMKSHSVAHGIRSAFQKLGMGKVPPIHGLRKNAIMNLIEAGCTPREVQAITGQSLQIVEHYAQGYNPERLAKAAIVKLEKTQKW